MPRFGAVVVVVDVVAAVLVVDVVVLEVVLAASVVVVVVDLRGLLGRVVPMAALEHPPSRALQVTIAISATRVLKDTTSVTTSKGVANAHRSAGETARVVAPFPLWGDSEQPLRVLETGWSPGRMREAWTKQT